MKRMPAILAALPLAVLSATYAPAAIAQTASPPSAATASASLFPADEDLQVMLDYLVEDGETPGIILGIVEADGSARILHAGSAGPGTQPLGPRTVFEIGSINKTFTGTVLADMVARGEVALDDPVQKYMPEGVRIPSRNGRQITLLDLATHRSGLPRLPNNHRPADRTNPYADYSVETMYAFLSSHELRRDIGAEFEYSNLGFGLLGHALGRAAGKPFEQLVRERVLEPLEMEMTGYGRDGEMGAWHAKGHDEAGRVTSFWEGTDAIHGAGGMRSSLEDMLDYLRAQLGPADNDLERAMRVAQREHHRYPENAIGLAWAIRQENGRTIISHGGGTGGFNTMIAFDPERRTGFVMLTNTGDFDDDVAMDFMVRGAPLSLPEARVPREVLARYAGEYQPQQGRPMFVRLEDDGTMTIRVGGNVRFRMYAESDSTFYLKRAPWRVRFTRDASGAVSGLALNIEGREQTARRISDRALTPSEEAAAIPDLPVTAADIARYEGTYNLQADGRTLTLRVFGQDGQLMAQAAGQDAFRLRYQGEHAFVPTFDNAVRLVFTIENGRATSVTLHQGGREITGPRAP